MDWLFDEIFNDVYPPGAENSPYELEVEDGSIEGRGWEAGITIAAIMNIDWASMFYGGRRRLPVTPPVPTPTRASACAFWVITVSWWATRAPNLRLRNQKR